MKSIQDGYKAPTFTNHPGSSKICYNLFMAHVCNLNSHAQFEANSMLGRRRLLPKPLLNAGESPPNIAVNRPSRRELCPPTARKSRPNFFAHCKRSTEVKKYKKHIIPNVHQHYENASHPLVSNYENLWTKWYVSISKHHINAWLMHVWVEKNIFKI